MTALVLPQSSLALIANVRVVTQPVVLSLCVTWTAGLTVHVSLAVTNACTLASLGRLAGLHPRLLPVGALVMVGGMVSVVQVLNSTSKVYTTSGF